MITVSAPIMATVPAVVALHSMPAMFSSSPSPIITSSLATVLILLRNCHFVDYSATRIQRKNYLANTEHKNNSYHRTYSGHKLIPPGYRLTMLGVNFWAGAAFLLYIETTLLTRRDEIGR